MKPHLALGGAIVGAWTGIGGPWWVVVLLIGAAWRWRGRPVGGALVAVAVLVLAGSSADRAHATLDFPDAGRFDDWVTLVDDPRSSGPVGVRVTVRSQRRLLVASAHGGTAGRLDDALAGERIRLIGTVRPVGVDDHRSIHRHVVGRITVAEVGESVGASPVAGTVNTVRRTLERGAASLTDDDRALFLGMVIGDDRGQGPVVADDFRAAGLGHLLVVSGQNVAFVLAVAMPVAGRLRPAGRALVLLLVLGLFAVMTRFEPSVLRATAMAGFGIGSAALGRPADGRAGLSWAVAGLLVVDPFLVHVVAFRLSAAATAGIVWLGGPLSTRLPGPDWLRIPVATTVAAQLAVSPVLVAVFGPIPLASLPANVAAGPVSGAVMIWGCTAGVLAGVLGGTAASVVHWPTTAMLWWIGGVARAAAAAPSAQLGGWSLVALGAGVGAALLRRTRAVGRASALVSGIVCVVSLVGAPAPAPGFHQLGEGVGIVQAEGGTVVVLDDPGPPQRVLEVVRTAGVRRPVLLVAVDGDRADADAVVALVDRFGSLPIAAPPLHRVPGARTMRDGRIVEVNGIVFEFVEVEPRLVFRTGSG